MDGYGRASEIRDEKLNSTRINYLFLVTIQLKRYMEHEISLMFMITTKLSADSYTVYDIWLPITWFVEGKCDLFLWDTKKMASLLKIQSQC